MIISFNYDTYSRARNNDPQHYYRYSRFCSPIVLEIPRVRKRQPGSSERFSTPEMIRGRRRVLMRSLIILLSLLIISATGPETEPITSSRSSQANKLTPFPRRPSFDSTPTQPHRNITFAQQRAWGCNGGRLMHKRCKERRLRKSARASIAKTTPLKKQARSFCSRLLR